MVDPRVHADDPATGPAVGRDRRQPGARPYRPDRDFQFRPTVGKTWRRSDRSKSTNRRIARVALYGASRATRIEAGIRTRPGRRPRRRSRRKANTRLATSYSHGADRPRA